MSDLDLQLIPDEELSFDMFDPAEVRPEVVSNEKPRMPRIAIVQATSADAIAAGARPGDFLVDWKDPTKPAQAFKHLRVYLIDVIKGRVMFPFKDDGKPDRSTKEPLCASSDGEKPRQSEMFDYVGKTHIDWRTKVPVTIVDSCEKCPLGQFKSYKDANGKVVNQPPPCQESPQFVLWLVDQKYAAIFQSSAPTVRNRLVGQVKKGYPGINKFFQPNGVDVATGKDTYPNIVDGKWFSVRLTTKLETHPTGNQTYVPVVELDATPLLLTDVRDVFNIKTLYKQADENGIVMRDILSGQAYLGEAIEYDEEGAPVQQTRLIPPGAAAAAKKLGNGGNKRRITDEHVTEEGAEVEADAF